MKKFKLLVMTVVILAFGFSLTACGPFEGFENDDLIKSSNSFSSTASFTNQTSTKFTFRCNKSNGVKKIKDITVPENPVFNISLTIESGRFKVVLIKDGEIHVICDSDNEGNIQTELPAGKYNLRMVAEDAKVNFTFNFNSYT